MIKGNKYDFKVGDTVILGESYNNAIEVEIVSFTEPNQLFATVKLLGKPEKWDVMTNRLTPLKDPK